MSHRATSDRTAVLTALRPGSAAEQGWDEQARDSVRLRIVNSDPTGSAPAISTIRRGHRTGKTRSRGFAVAAAGALLVAGGGVAAANGRLPLAFTQAFATWAGDWSMNGVQGADPDTAERVASTTGPDGTTFTVMAAPTTTTDGGRGACTVAVLETAASTRDAGPSDFQDVSSNWCHSSIVGQPFGVMGTDAAYAADSTLGVMHDLWVWSAAAGDAVRAELVTADGRTWPAVSYDGVLYGWFPALREGDARPQLIIGYAADGTEVDRAPV